MYRPSGVRILQRIAIFMVIAGAGAAAGFGLAYGVMIVWGAFQGPFQMEWTTRGTSEYR
jgi:hypothetical protein